MVRLLAGSSIVLGMTLTGIGMMQSFTNAASAATGQGQLLAGTVGGYSEYSICQGVTGVCSDRGQAAGIDDTGAIAVDGNLEGNQFYVGLGLANSVVVSAEGNVSGTVFIQGSGNVGAYGGSVPAGNVSPQWTSARSGDRGERCRDRYSSCIDGLSQRQRLRRDCQPDR